ncbi:hypothetical protein [Demequina sp. NBRC 110056]|uniref:hypothetical protein n=1 Tax=Demequina sp. NBRC 110056 TaxID=1570345 RepID=UPI000A0286CB|nr:hypothetical protein [Demequina sp. NBRC 110056]
MNRAVTIAALAVPAALAGCSSAGVLSITNDSGLAVDVSTGDERLPIDPYGGVALFDYGCTPGDVTLTFSDDTVVSVPGPVCPPDEIRIASASHVTVVTADA